MTIDIKDYVNKGLLKEQNADFRQIERQIVRAEKDLNTFQLVIDEDPEWASTIAYQSMLRAGRALLFSFGYLPSDGRQHRTVVELSGIILGKEYSLLIKQFDRLRKKRNVFFYDSEDAMNRTEAKTALKTAKQLLLEIKKKIQKNNPQCVFEF